MLMDDVLNVVVNLERELQIAKLREKEIDFTIWETAQKIKKVESKIQKITISLGRVSTENRIFQAMLQALPKKQ